MLNASQIIKDVAYAKQSESQKLDIYIPDKGAKPYPVIIWIHPGGFFSGDKSGDGLGNSRAIVDMNKLVPPILARGYAVVSMNYRLSQEAPFPALVYDVKATVRWARANAAKYGFDSKNIAAWGSSAGGYLAAFLAVSEGVKELEDLSLGNPEQSSRVIAAVDWFGPTDFLKMDSQTIQLGFQLFKGGHNAPKSYESELIGAPITEAPEKCEAANPMTYIKKEHAPLYIQHGTDHDAVPHLQSVIMVEKFKAVGGPNEVIFEIFEDSGKENSSFFNNENINKILDFIDKYVK
jgi:acetyl esterase/lipase